MTDTNHSAVCTEKNTKISVDDAVKGIIEGMIFVIPETPEMPKNNDTINVNGFTATLLKYGNVVKSTTRIRDTGNQVITFTLDLKVSNDTKSHNCSLKFFVYELQSITDSNDVKVFGTPSQNIMEYIESANIRITHRCCGHNVNSQLCDCVTKLNGCIIECTKVSHNVSKAILCDLIKNNMYDMRSLSCVPFTKNGGIVMRLMKDPSMIDDIEESLATEHLLSQNIESDPGLVYIDSKASDFVLIL